METKTTPSRHSEWSEESRTNPSLCHSDLSLCHSDHSGGIPLDQIIRNDTPRNSRKSISFFSRSFSLSGFTLIELIVVITILTILGSIGFVTMTGYFAGARDSVRLTDMNNIYGQLNLTLGREGDLPMPDDAREVTLSGSTITYQGYAGKTVLSAIKFEKGGRDPKDDVYYTYTINKTKSKAQLLGYFEEYDVAKLAHLSPLIPQAQAAAPSDYSARKIGIIGKKIGVVVDSTTLVPVQQISSGTLSITDTSTGYTMYFDSVTSGSGTGVDLKTAFLEESVASGSLGQVSVPTISIYSGSLVYTSGQSFIYNGTTVTVTGTGIGTASTKADSNCNSSDIAIWSGSYVQIWAACNAGANTLYNPVVHGWSGTEIGAGIEANRITAYSGVINSATNFLGNYYQWWRNDPVNLLGTGIITAASNTRNYQTGGITLASGSGFIIGVFSLYTWINDTNHNSSSGVVWTKTTPGNNGPCPIGYHIPTGGTSDTTTEWGTAYVIGTGSVILGSCSQVSAYDRLRCALALPISGYRVGTTGAFQAQGLQGFYWSSSPAPSNPLSAYDAGFYAGGGIIANTFYRTGGYSIRCLKN